MAESRDEVLESPANLEKRLERRLDVGFAQVRSDIESLRHLVVAGFDRIRSPRE